jgi:hypothetical protein
MKPILYRVAVLLARLGKLTRNCPKFSATITRAGWRIYRKL